ncbi:MAG: hypothetical protein C5B49_05700 [Bdellovibrio sp.]|nr:MAG: hypothetical protein C5B49_05700 [Bdellovibrio sp.]
MAGPTGPSMAPAMAPDSMADLGASSSGGRAPAAVAAPRPDLSMIGAADLDTSSMTKQITVPTAGADTRPVTNFQPLPPPVAVPTTNPFVDSATQSNLKSRVIINIK